MKPVSRFNAAFFTARVFNISFHTVNEVTREKKIQRKKGVILIRDTV